MRSHKITAAENPSCQVSRVCGVDRLPYYEELLAIMGECCIQSKRKMPASKEVDAAIASVIAELESISSLKEDQRAELMAFLH